MSIKNVYFVAKVTNFNVWMNVRVSLAVLFQFGLSCLEVERAAY